MSMMRAALAGDRIGMRSKQIILRQEQQWQYHQQRKNGISASQLFHTHAAGGPWDRRKERENEQGARHLTSSFAINPNTTMQVSQFHTTAASEKGIALVLGLGALSATAYAGASAVTAWKEYKASLPSEEELEEQRKQQEEEQAAGQEEQQQEAQQANNNAKGERENIFSKWFGVGVGAKYYEGGFEDTMTRREAALILGVRESSPPSRIKDAHRRLLVLNHPDTGGSTYVSLKINEAKELLLKGRRK